MTDPILIATLALTTLAGLSILCFTMLRGWHGWLELQRLGAHAAAPDNTPSPVTRIELADLRERVRKLEAIAAGVDL